MLEVTIWVCYNCGNYYASSSVGDLREEYNHDAKGKPTFARSRCPSMRCANQDIHREPVRVTV